MASGGPSLRRCAQVELLRWQRRPVLGRRAPWVLAGLAIVSLVLFHAAGVVGGHQLGDVLRSAAKAWAAVAFCIGAWTAHDAMAAGVVAADRAQVGRPSASFVVQSLAGGAWCGLLGAGVATAIVAGNLAVVVAALPATPTDGGWVLGGAGQLVLGAALAGIGGVAVALAVRSGFVAMGAFFVMLVVADPLLVADRSWIAPFLVPDNLLAAASGQTEGLASQALGHPGAVASAVAATAFAVIAGAGYERLRDAPARS